MTNSENKEYDLSVTYGEQINYVFITLKELIIMQWEYIRKHRLWRVFNNNVENLP